MSGFVRHLRHRNCWQARVWDPTLERERTKVFAHGVTSRQEARRLSFPVLAQLQADVEQAKTEAGTVGLYARTWLKRKRQHLSPSTIQQGYEPIVARIIARFGRRRLVDLKTGDVKAWYDELRAKGLSDRTVERHHQVLRAMMLEAVEDGLIARPPTKFRRPKLDKPRMHLPTIDAVIAILAATRGDFGRLLRVTAETGMRRGEVVALKWEDVSEGPPTEWGPSLLIRVRRSMLELQGGELREKTTKTGEERVVQVDDAAVAALVEQAREYGTSGWVFPDPLDPGKPRRPGWVTQRWRRLRDAHGLTGVRFHDLRHFHATHLIEQGIPVTVVSRRLGHSKTSTTLDIYAGVTAPAEIEAARAARIAETPAP